MLINPLRLNDIKLLEENGSGVRGTLKTSASTWTELEIKICVSS